MKYELEAFEDMVKHGYLRKAETEDLVLYGYTDQCTFARAWDTIYTRDARGIIFEKKTGRLVAKPFPKFFNLGEMEEVSLLNLPKLPYRVFEKLDGSLGIIYHYGGQWNVATRGSFSSEQAVKAQEMLKKYTFKKGFELAHDFTFLVEIIYPQNKIIVNYGNQEKLVLLSVYRRSSGKEIENWGAVKDIAEYLGMEVAKTYDHTIEQMIEMQKTMPKDQEGFVVRFEGGLRVKIKGHEYLKIAKIMSQMSPLSAWEAMEAGFVKKEYLQQIPEELLKEFQPIVDLLELQYFTVENEIRMDMRMLPVADILSKEAKKTLGLFLQGKHGLKHPSAMFLILNGQDEAIEKYVMKQIRPNGNNLSGVA